MKKIGFLLAVAMITFSSCESKDAFTVTGNLNSSSHDGKKVYLQKIGNLFAGSVEVVDSTIVKNGKFIFKGIAGGKPEMRMASLEQQTGSDVAPEQITMASFVLEAGKINVSLDKENLAIGGTPLNEEFNQSHQLSNKLVALYRTVMEAGGLETLEQNPTLTDEFTALKSELDSLNFEMTKTNMNSPLGEFLFISSLQSNSVEPSQIKELLSLADPAFVNTPEIKQLQTNVENALQQETFTSSLMNQSYTDVEVENQQGKSVKLSGYVGNKKYVLVDFWASWCQPCINEMPFLTAAYKKYKSKGFEIVAISIDEDKKAWNSAIKKHNMSWIQLIDGKERNASQTYSVRSIPFSLLLDEKGTIVAMNPRGEELDLKLSELIKEK